MFTFLLFCLFVRDGNLQFIFCNHVLHFVSGNNFLLGLVCADGRLPFAHAIWHLFVAAAAAVHLHAVYSFVLILE